MLDKIYIYLFMNTKRHQINPFFISCLVSVCFIPIFLSPIYFIPSWVLLLIFTIFFITNIPSERSFYIDQAALTVTSLIFMESIFFLLGYFDETSVNQQFQFFYVWSGTLNMKIQLGVDGLSILFINLVTFLIPICLLAGWGNVPSRTKREYYAYFLLLEILLILAFSVSDLLLFYIFFELSLIPMFLLIGVWGSRVRKVRASYFLFIYTFWGSILMLFAIVFIHVFCSSTSYPYLICYPLSKSSQITIWPALFFAFASKIPMMPFHLWLPEAHVEASTPGSVILAGILLKLGTYGFIKFALGICPSACFFFSPLIFTLGCTGIFYASFTAIRQTDLKRIIAYTSVAHMNLVMIGIFCFNTEGIEGAIFQSLCHGFVSSALFLLIGVLYDRHKTRLLTYFSGLVSTMPLFSLFFLFFTMSNIALPPTGSFFAEFLILFSVLKASPLICFFSATGMIWGGAYSLWLLNRIIYGNVKTQFEFRSTDLDLKEFIMFIPLVLCTCLVGVCPNLILDIIGPSVQFLLTITKYN